MSREVSEVNGFEKRARTKRQAILDASKDAFISRGISDVTIEEIAESAGVSKVTIFKYFGDKTSLAREVLLPFVEEWIAYYEKLARRDAPFSKKMEKIIRHKASMRDMVGSSLWHEVILKDKAMQTIATDMLETRQYQLYMQLIRSGKESGDIDANIPDEAILMYISGFLSLWGTENFSQASEKAYLGLMKLFFKGLVGR